MGGHQGFHGLNVVETAADGSFTLPGHERERFVFITTPSGYKTFNHYHKIEEKQSGYDFGLMPYGGRIRKDGSHNIFILLILRYLIRKTMKTG